MTIAVVGTPGQFSRNATAVTTVGGSSDDVVGGPDLPSTCDGTPLGVNGRQELIPMTGNQLPGVGQHLCEPSRQLRQPDAVHHLV